MVLMDPGVFEDDEPGKRRLSGTDAWMRMNTVKREGKRIFPNVVSSSEWYLSAGRTGTCYTLCYLTLHLTKYVVILCP